jgi:hypothetical protein
MQRRRVVGFLLMMLRGKADLHGRELGGEADLIANATCRSRPMDQFAGLASVGENHPGGRSHGRRQIPQVDADR